MSFEKSLAQLKAQNARKPKPPAPPPPPERRKATVKAYRHFTHVYSHAVYSAAYSDPKGYNEFLDPKPTGAELGRALRAALAASRFITPDHPEWDSVMVPPGKDEVKAWEENLKRRAGVKTHKALYDGAACVSVTLREGEIQLSPLRYRGSGGWEGIKGHEPTRLPQSVADAELGGAVAVAIERSIKAK